MFTLNPKHVDRGVAHQKGQRCADQDRCYWHLYYIYSGDRRTLISYDFLRDDEPKRALYYQRPADAVFFPQGTDEEWAMAENERAERMVKR